MGIIQVKPGVQFSVIAPGGFRILSAIDCAAQELSFDLTITSACDGEHSGPDDPHHRGEAYDLRSHDLSPEQKYDVIMKVMHKLGYDRFFGFVEAPDSDNEHFHFQIKKGTTYP